MHEVLVNRLGGLSLPRKSVVRLTDRPDMTLDVYRGRKTTKQQLFAPLRFLLKEYHETRLSLIYLNDPSDRATQLRCVKSLRYIYGLPGSYSTVY